MKKLFLYIGIMVLLSTCILFVYSNSGRFKNTPEARLEEIAGTNNSVINKNTSTTATKVQVDTTIKIDSAK